MRPPRGRCRVFMLAEEAIIKARRYSNSLREIWKQLTIRIHCQSQSFTNPNLLIYSQNRKAQLRYTRRFSIQPGKTLSPQKWRGSSSIPRACPSSIPQGLGNKPRGFENSSSIGACFLPSVWGLLQWTGLRVVTGISCNTECSAHTTFGHPRTNEHIDEGWH